MTAGIERVARALCAHSGKDPDSVHPLNPDLAHWRLFVGKARCAMAAIRKPTEAMKDRGFEQFDFDECGDDAFHKRVCGRVFEAMIDAALNDDAPPLTGATP